MSSPPAIGSTVQVEGPDTGFVGKVIAVVRTPSVVIQTTSGRMYVVPAEGHTFLTGDTPEDEPPVREPPDGL